MMGKDSQANHEKAKLKMKIDYTQAQNQWLFKGLDAVQEASALAVDPSVNLANFMQRSTNLMAKTFKLRTLAIGLIGADGQYRYQYMSGIRDEAWTILRSKSYVENDFYESKYWNGFPIGKLTKLYPFEDDPYIETERDSFNRPSIVGIRRRTPEDWVEGDYIDVHIRGSRGNLLGWIEILGVSDGRIPDVATIKFLEVIGSIIGRRMESKRT